MFLKINQNSRILENVTTPLDLSDPTLDLRRRKSAETRSVSGRAAVPLVQMEPMVQMVAMDQMEENPTLDPGCCLARLS